MCSFKDYNQKCQFRTPTLAQAQTRLFSRDVSATLDLQVMYCLEHLHLELIISVYSKDGSANTGRPGGLLFFS